MCGRVDVWCLQVVPIAWVNMNVFDYASKLQTGRSILYGWPVEEELEECVNYMGSTMLNPSTSECVVLEVDCSIPNLSPSLRRASRPIMYPSIDQIRKVARELAEGSIPTVSASLCVPTHTLPPSLPPSSSHTCRSSSV